MTMNVRVKRHLSPDDYGFSLERERHDRRNTGAICAMGWADPREGYLIECEMIHPASVKGRTVLLRLTEKDRDDLMLLLRSEAIRARRGTA